MKNADEKDEEIERMAKEIEDIEKYGSKEKYLKEKAKREHSKNKRKTGKAFGVNFFNKKDNSVR